MTIAVLTLTGFSLELCNGFPETGTSDSPARLAGGRTVEGLSVGVLGGFRALAADLVWLRAYVAWERHDAAATEALIKLTTTLDVRCLRFWISGARIMAYEIPNWRVEISANAGPIEQKRVVG